MQPRSDAAQYDATFTFPRLGGTLLIVLLGTWTIVTLARSVPDLIRRFEEPCAGCYVGAFRPYGATSRRTEATATSEEPPGAMPGQKSSSSGTRVDEATLWFPPNDNDAPHSQPGHDISGIDQSIGVVIAEQFYSGGIGERQIRDVNFRDPGATGAMTVPGPESSTPVWAFTFGRPPLGSTPDTVGTMNSPSTQKVPGGPGNDAPDADLAAFPGVGWNRLDGEGIVRGTGAIQIPGSVPLWRVAVQKDLEQHFLQVSTREESIAPSSGDNASEDTRREFTGMAPALNDRFMIDPIGPIKSRLSDQSPLTLESWSGETRFSFLSVRVSNTPETFRAGQSHGFAATVATSIQPGHAARSADATEYASPGVSRTSGGMVAEVVYSPRGKPDSLIQFVNPRFAAQFVAYREFKDVARGASGNNIFYLSLLGALHF